MNPRVWRAARRFMAAFAVLVVDSAPGKCAAQDRKPFFPRNYAAAPGQAEPALQRKPTATPLMSPSPGGRSAEDSQPTSQGKLFNEFDSASDDAHSREESVMEEAGGIDIYAVRLMVSSTNTQHLLAVLFNLRDLGLTRRVPIRSVDVVGPALPMPLQLALLKYGVTSKATMTMENPEFEQSPLWILETPKGLVYLEGIMSPLPYITKNGKFISRE